MCDQADADRLERFKLQYQHAGDMLRHYSATRSALVAFLLTTAGAAFAESFKPEHRMQPASDYLLLCGCAVTVAAFLVCLLFSHLTQKMMAYQNAHIDWKCPSTFPGPIADFVPAKSLRGKMLRDPLNWMMALLGGVMILGCLWARACNSQSCLAPYERFLCFSTVAYAGTVAIFGVVFFLKCNYGWAVVASGTVLWAMTLFVLRFW
jgi:hypothetical protein